ncbi:hypothetical protein GCM10027592_61270 [Spirosoma flavus]
MTFTVSYVGYITQEYIFKRGDLPIYKNQILLHVDNTFIVEVIIVKQKKKWWQRKRKNRD